METQNTQISCRIGTTDPASLLGLEIWLDHEQIFNSEHVNSTVDFKHEFADTEAEHQLRFVLKNKLAEHTTIDADGNIIKDARLTISNVVFENIEIDQVFLSKSVYTHNFNNTQPEIKDQFFGEMGCNGTVAIDFTTPIYLWLLESM